MLFEWGGRLGARQFNQQKCEVPIRAASRNQLYPTLGELWIYFSGDIFSISAASALLKGFGFSSVFAMAGWKRPSVSSRNELGLLGAGSLALAYRPYHRSARLADPFVAFGVLVDSGLLSGPPVFQG